MNKPMPYEFLLDYLPAGIIIKPAIGMFYVYFDGKIVLIFRETQKNAQHNGIWISTMKEHHSGLKTAIPAIRNFELEDGFDTSWLLLPYGDCDFEDASIKLCELVACKDSRIGKVTQASAALFR